MKWKYCVEYWNDYKTHVFIVIIFNCVFTRKNFIFFHVGFAPLVIIITLKIHQTMISRWWSLIHSPRILISRWWSLIHSPRVLISRWWSLIHSPRVLISRWWSLIHSPRILHESKHVYKIVIEITPNSILLTTSRSFVWIWLMVKCLRLWISKKKKKKKKKKRIVPNSWAASESWLVKSPFLFLFLSLSNLTQEFACSMFRGSHEINGEPWALRTREPNVIHKASPMVAAAAAAIATAGQSLWKLVRMSKSAALIAWIM